MCGTGPGALAGVPLMAYGIHGMFAGANNMVHGAAGRPFVTPPANSGPAPTPAPIGGANDPGDPMYHPSFGPF